MVSRLNVDSIKPFHGKIPLTAHYYFSLLFFSYIILETSSPICQTFALPLEEFQIGKAAKEALLLESPCAIIVN
jgi:hypothetical protein